MKKSILLLLLFCTQYNFAQGKLSKNEIYKQIGLTWGLLKYHHPHVSSGKYDWDSVLISELENAENIETQNDLNIYLLGFINKYNLKNVIFEKRKIKIDSSKLFFKNYDYSWIKAKTFGSELTSKLENIKTNKNIGRYYAKVNSFTRRISFSNEKGFDNFDVNNKYNRLLFLFSFWNAMQYWNVNKYLTEENWFTVLDEKTDEFANADTATKFEIAKLKLVTKLSDPHSFNYTNYSFDLLYKFLPAFKTKVLNDTLIVNSVQNYSLSIKNGIEVGDLITKIKNKSINSYITENFTDILPTSNITELKRWLGYGVLLSNNKDSINVEIIDKKGVVKNKFIKLHSTFPKSEFKTIDSVYIKKYQLLKPNIGYINLSQINRNELKTAFKLFSNTKGVVIDLRNYPKNIRVNDVCKMLYSKNQVFVKAAMPIKSLPSIYEYDAKSIINFLFNPFKGRGSSSYYKGKVILLVDRNTMSRAEFIGISIQQAPNCITIGEQTAGSIMDVIAFTAPDKTEINFTGYNAFYPNGKNVQRNGLKLDYKINETAKNYNPNLYISTAIKLIEQ